MSHPFGKSRIKEKGGAFYYRLTANGDYVLSSGAVAKNCGVATRTASKWIDAGLLKGYRIPGSSTSGGDRRVYAKDLVAFMEKRGMVIAPGLRALVAELRVVICGMLAPDPTPADWGEPILAPNLMKLGAVLADPRWQGVVLIGPEFTNQDVMTAYYHGGVRWRIVRAKADDGRDLPEVAAASVYAAQREEVWAAVGLTLQNLKTAENGEFP